MCNGKFPWILKVLHGTINVNKNIYLVIFMVGFIHDAPGVDGPALPNQIAFWHIFRYFVPKSVGRSERHTCINKYRTHPWWCLRSQNAWDRHLRDSQGLLDSQIIPLPLLSVPEQNEVKSLSILPSFSYVSVCLTTKPFPWKRILKVKDYISWESIILIIPHCLIQ